MQQSLHQQQEGQSQESLQSINQAELNIKKIPISQNDLYFTPLNPPYNSNINNLLSEEGNRMNHTKSHHKSVQLRLKDDSQIPNLSKVEDLKPTSSSPNRQFLNFPQIDYTNKKKALLSLQQQQLYKKNEVSLNGASSLPKLKPLSEYQIQNQIPNNNQKVTRKKLSQNEWQINEQIQYFQGVGMQKSNIPKNLKLLQQRPRIKLMEYIPTDPNSENTENPFFRQQKMQEKYKSLLQLRSPNSQYPLQNQNSPIRQSQGQSSAYNIPKEKYSIPYLSNKVEQQQKEFQRQQQLAIQHFNESIDRRFKFACKTKAGCTMDKTPKTNQDSPIIYPKQLGEQGVALFAVCDGHGTNGHFVSGIIRKSLPKHMIKYIKEIKKKQQNKQPSNQLIDDNKEIVTQNGGNKLEPVLSASELKGFIQKGFYDVNSDILKCEYDTNLSGSTLVSVFIVGNTVICANVGDSRAVIAKQKFGNEFRAYPLSIDHKPSLEREKQRIIQSGGRVQSQKDHLGNQVGPLRVWMNSIDMPGLAMTRSFGDKAGIQAGVICEPEILESELSEEDKFIIVASDGVWEYISNQDAIRIVQPYYEKGQVEQAAERLVIEASNAWKRESYSRDDITCIVIFLQSKQELEKEDNNANMIIKANTNNQQTNQITN